MATLPVYFHNHDMHALCLNGFSNMSKWELKAICQTKEKYITVAAKTVVGQQEHGQNIYFEIKFINIYQFIVRSRVRVESRVRRI